MVTGMEKPYVVGMDIGGTNTVFGIVDSRGNVLATDSVKTQSFSKIEEECGCGYYVMCMECGCHSVTIDFHSEEERLDAAKRTVMLWNTGKVISSSPGE